jgi:hypothetical protein
MKWIIVVGRDSLARPRQVPLGAKGYNGDATSIGDDVHYPLLLRAFLARRIRVAERRSVAAGQGGGTRSIRSGLLGYEVRGIFDG